MNNIAKLRKEKNLTQTTLSQSLNISQSTLCQYEKGKRNPSIDILKRIAKILDCSIVDLVGE